MKKTLTLLLISLCLTGCLTLKTTKTPVCETIPQGSYSVICDIAGRIGTTPETAAGMLKFANTGLLAEDIYTAKEAQVFIRDVKAQIESVRKTGVTYAVARRYAAEKYGSLSRKAKAALVLMEEFTSFDDAVPSERLLSDYDYTLLLKHLDDQERIAQIFLD
jgi:hypothetical protein